MKREPMAGEGERDLWLGPTLRHWPTAPSAPCVDAETLAAWAEGRLDAKQASAVELHASDCPHCMAMLASMERTTPVAEEPKRAWSTGSLLRWLVPLTAAATAIAIWILVPNRQVTQMPPAPVPEASAPQRSARLESAPPESARQDQSRELAKEPDVPAPTPMPAGKPDQPAQDQFAPVLPAERRAIERQPPAGARENMERRAETKEERQALDALRERSLSTLRDRAAPAPSQAPAPPPSAPTAPANETFAAPMLQQQLAAPAAPSSESTAPSDPLIRWRVIGWAAVERSIDGGNTWIKTSAVPGVTPDSLPMLWVVSVRAVDNLRGTVLTSDRREFYTTNGGISWERVQENSVAPF